MILKYLNLPVTLYTNQIDDNYYEEPYYDTIERNVQYEYEVDDGDVINYLSEIISEEDLPDFNKNNYYDELTEYIEDNLEDLSKKYQDELLSYFEDEAIKEAEYKLDASDFIEENFEKNKDINEDVRMDNPNIIKALAYLDDNPDAFAYICSVEVDHDELPIGVGIDSSEDYYEYTKKLKNKYNVNYFYTIYQDDKEKYRRVLHDFDEDLDNLNESMHNKDNLLKIFIYKTDEGNFDWQSNHISHSLGEFETKEKAIENAKYNLKMKGYNPRDFEITYAVDEDLDITHDPLTPVWEDTVKQGNSWVNRGKEGIHGKFKTKKEADEQRKAMFVNSNKNRNFGESIKEDIKDKSTDYNTLVELEDAIDELMDKISDEVHKSEDISLYKVYKNALQRCFDILHNINLNEDLDRADKYKDIEPDSDDLDFVDYAEKHPADKKDDLFVNVDDDFDLDVDKLSESLNTFTPDISSLKKDSFNNNNFEKSIENKHSETIDDILSMSDADMEYDDIDNIELIQD